MEIEAKHNSEKMFFGGIWFLLHERLFYTGMNYLHNCFLALLLI